MMRRWPIVFALLAASTVAHAGDKPLIVPVPAWVVPVEPPVVPPAVADDAPITVLLADQQLRFERDGTTSFGRTAIRINSAQGLTAGNISLPWRPDVGDLQVHQLAIRRGATVIDVLASGQTFTVVRREPNLESATFDGVLTANIQPEGLQIGDIVEMAVSVTARDPVLAGHVEELAAIGGPLPVARAHLRASWPVGLAVRHRVAGALPVAKAAKRGGDEVIEWSFDRLAPAEPVKFAPARFQLGRLVELSDFAAWSDVGALLAPLYAKAAVLPATGPLADEVARIRAASSDPAARTTAALALVQDRVRYVALAMGTGGLVPADAATTWARRYGDCKAKTALLLAILRALDVSAEPVAVNALAGDGIDQRLPAIGAFNHVLVRATVAGKPYWLDGTRTGDTALDRLAVPAFGWGLPVVPKGAALVRMVLPPMTVPTSETHVAIDATAGLAMPAPAEVSWTLRGDEAIGTNAVLSGYAGEARDRALRELWRRQYDFIDIDSTAAAFDRATGELRLSMKGKARMDWSSGWYETDGLGLGYKADFAREPGPGRDAPFVVGYPRFTRNSETIKLPPGFRTTLAADKLAIDRTIGGVEYRRSGGIKDGVFHAEASERALAPEFPASEAPAVQAALRDMAAAIVYLRRPPGYALTEAELAAAMKATPATAEQFNVRGYALADRGRHAEAIAQFDAALAREPGNANTLANRGLSRVWMGETAAAEADLLAAEKLDPRHLVVHRGRGIMAQRRADPLRAIAEYDKALAIDPTDGFSRGHRAEAYRSSGRVDEAFAEATALLAIDPSRTDMRLLRVNILRSRRKTDEALAEIKAGVAANPGDTMANVAAGNVHAALGRHEEAMRYYDAALAIRPEAYTYLNRAASRAGTDLAGRLADADAALALVPDMPDALVLKAGLLRQRGNPAAAVELLDRVLQVQPGNTQILIERATAHGKAGHAVEAARDFAAARTAAGNDAVLLNNVCWGRAVAGVTLEAALVDCDAAVAKQPGAAGHLDSKGLVLLRLKRFAEADRTYTAALEIDPTLAGSLWGRGVARVRMGDRTGGDADLAAARQRDPGVEAEFTGYGVVPGGA